MEISVILVTCDRPVEVFMRAYKSVRNQTYAPKELIIVNAGKNEIPILLNERIISIPGVNASIARNIGAKYATSDFIAFLDDDDEWKIDHLYSHICCFTDGLGLIYSERSDVGIWDIAEHNIMVRNWIGPTSFVTISKAIFDKVGGFDESFDANQEWDLWMRVVDLAMVVKSKPDTVIKHTSPVSISTNIRKRINGWESILKKHLAYYKDNPEVFIKVTQVFKDEMHAKHSIIGTLRAMVWCRFAQNCMNNNN